MITEIRFLDSCLPCYFQGYAGVVLAVPCHAGMTWGDLRAGVDDDSNAADHGVEDWTGFDSELDSTFHGLNPDARVDFLDHDLMESEEREAEESGIELDESVYAYFAIVESSE